jgi:general secretion pathway protein F
MNTYRYQAARADGRIVSGVIDSSRAIDVSAVLLERGLHAIAVQDIERPSLSQNAAPRRELAVVFRSLSSLTGAGVPIDKALAATEHVAGGRLKGVLTHAREALREGSTLAEALAASQGQIPAIAIGMVRAGERGGRLERALDEVASHIEQEAEMIGRMRQALAYPILLAVVGTATVIVIATVVVPRFAELLADVGQELPVATQTLLAVSGFLSQHGVLLGSLLLGGIWLTREWLKKPAASLALHRALLASPIVGKVRHSLAAARTCRALAGMLEAGMPLLHALDAAREATGDRAVVDRLKRVREQVAGGSPLTVACEREHALTPLAHQLLAVGEGSGQLASMTARAGDLAAQEAERQIKTLVSMLEPALIVAFGGLVAFVATALLQAVYGLRAG